MLKLDSVVVNSFILLLLLAASDPVGDVAIDRLVDGLNRSSQMDEDFLLRAAESDESL